jgi:hypothetical protein
MNFGLIYFCRHIFRPETTAASWECGWPNSLLRKNTPASTLFAVKERRFLKIKIIIIKIRRIHQRWIYRRDFRQRARSKRVVRFAKGTELDLSRQQSAAHRFFARLLSHRRLCFSYRFHCFPSPSLRRKYTSLEY